MPNAVRYPTGDRAATPDDARLLDRASGEVGECPSCQRRRPLAPHGYCSEKCLDEMCSEGNSD